MSTAPKPKAELGIVSGFGQFHTNEADPSNPGKKLTPYVAITWDQIRALVDNPASVPKPEAQWAIASTEPSRSKVKQEAEGQFHGLWADFDLDPKPISEVADALDLVVLGYDTNREQYSSRSATVAKPKSRAMVPLAKPLIAGDWLICQRIFNDLLRMAGLNPDPVTERVSQVCYLPNRGDFYETSSRRDGVDFDPLKSWATQITAKRAEVAAEDEAARRLKDQRAEARKRREALREATGTTGLGIIEAFNLSYTPEDFLIRAGYEQRGDSFKHPGSQSGSFSASIKEGADGVLRVHSLSSSDPLYTGGGGGGAHDAFSTFTVLNHGGDVSEATKAAGTQWLMIGTESWNKVQQREWAKSKSSAAAGFDSLDDEEIDSDTGEVKKKIHPLAKFVDYGTAPTALEWVLQGFIGTGIVTFSGAAGVGKTTVLLPLAMAAAGLHGWGYALAPKPDRWRHVVYITEDVQQAQRIVAGMLGATEWDAFSDSTEPPAKMLDKARVIERLHIVDAVRLDVVKVAKVAKDYRELFTRTVKGVEIQPLVVLDTKAAVLETDDENSNSEASRIVNTLKQGFEGLPTWIVGHVAKQTVGRSDLASMSMRGGSAFEADANQCLYLVTGDQKGDQKGAEQRYLVRGKTRFEAKWSELAVQSYTSTTTAKDVFGDEETVTLRWAIASPGFQTRAQAKTVNQEESRRENDVFVRDEILEAVTAACAAGTPLNRAAVKAELRRKAEAVVGGIEALLTAGLLVEVHVPSNMRVHPKKDSFLVNLNSDEQAEFIRSGTVPAAKLVIPPSWKKAGGDVAGKPAAKSPKGPISSVPEACLF